ncbi:MAG TPA: biotin--[acetyl-CoA-carboxylase] ligase [Actinomycetota bacterium]|nr:biotin--[acetyl-CoA-carboxylase] ligase [Actinomycetota bacterium]
MDDLVIDAIREGLSGTRFSTVEVHESVDSTQAVLVREGGADGRVLVADHQTQGRGRSGRAWASPPGTSLLFSALLVGVEPAFAPLVSLQAGLSVALAIERLGPRPQLKWPNDVLIGGRKVCGVLGELAGGLVVVGVGLNVSQSRAQLPEGVDATSLALELEGFGGPPGFGGSPPKALRRDRLLVDVLRQLDRTLAAPDWLDDYRSRCATIGSRVRIQVPGDVVEGVAEAVASDGALVVDGRPLYAGDVIHLRAAGG